MSRLSALVASLLALSCAPPAATPRSSGSIAVSHDDALLFVADADRDLVVVLDTASRAVVRETKVGRQPERVLIGPDGAVFVSCRGDRTVARLSPGGEVVEATATVGAEPVGLALSADHQRLLVANSMSGTLSVLDARSLAARREVSVGGQPWALAASADGRRVYVTDFGAGALRVVDLESGSGALRTLEQPPEAECARGRLPRRTPAQAADVVLSPDGDRAYVAHVQSRTGSAARVQPSLRLAVAPALSTVETTNDTVLVDDGRAQPGASSGEPGRHGFPPALLSTNLDPTCGEARGGSGLDAPSALVVDGAGAWVYVVDHNSDAVAVVSATGRVDERYRVPERGIADVVRVGTRPTGIAVAGDLTRAWVHNSLDATVSLVESRRGRLAQTAVIPFERAALAPEVDRGRRLFYSAVDPRLTQPEFGGVSCSSCHPYGRADGLSWVLPGARGGPRNTPPLWGVTATAPYHWDGALADLPAFTTRMVNQMGGRGLSRDDASDLAAYLATVPAPDNPSAGLLAPGLVARGETLFASRCATCHAGEALTDGRAHGSTRPGAPQLDTPSLRGVFATAPFLHDGSARSLRQVLVDPRASIAEHDQRALSVAELEALEGFLMTR